MDIRRYTQAEEQKLIALMRKEGSEWECYYAEEAFEKYRQALACSITYAAYIDDTLCGYIRCREDSGFGVYIYDLLVDKDYRGMGYGRKLMDRVCSAFPDQQIYVMSDADGYYEKQGFIREGSIFIVKPFKESV